MRYFDAHNHLHDERLQADSEELLRECCAQGLYTAVVNGSCEGDWGDVLALAKRSAVVIPSFGYHPWYVNERSSTWSDVLVQMLRTTPSAVGEIGLDRWKTEFDPAVQEEVFMTQVEIAQQENLPMSIHGLRAWGRLYDLLRSTRIPSCGFLLHSYGGPREMIPQFAKLGAYFSCPGFFLNPGREMKLALFQHVPPDRLLLETDAPDQPLPDALDRYRLPIGPNGRRVNHPANITAVYEGFAKSQGVDPQALATQIERNFRALFGALVREHSEGPQPA